AWSSTSGTGWGPTTREPVPAQLDERGGSEAADGGLVIFGGALLLTPGFVTDLVGLLMLIPGSRDLVRRFMVARAIDIGVGGMGRPVAWGVRGARWGTRGYRYANGRRAAREYDVEGTATEVTDPAASLPPRSSS
ncbi:MAG: FxsA family protein, partial [Solirubrobacterales bacterium]